MKPLRMNIIHHGDCLQVLKKFPAESIDLIITSPPYADNRSNVRDNYVGVKPKDYVDWFLPISKEIKRVIKPKGTFVLNVKERVNNGERGTYIYELVLEMRKRQKWLWTEEYVWNKKTTIPGYWKNRFRDLWERCYQFNKQKDFNMYQNNVKVPIGEWAKKRIQRPSDLIHDYDKIRRESKTLSGFGVKVANWQKRGMVNPGNMLNIPENIIETSSETGNKNHSAVYPQKLPEWFIKLFTNRKSHVVLDPFIGSGTTAIAALSQNRKYIGIELNKDSVRVAEERINEYLSTQK